MGLVDFFVLGFFFSCSWVDEFMLIFSTTKQYDIKMGIGHIWAIAAGLNAALAAVSAKFISTEILKYAVVVLCNVTMWGCFVNSLKTLDSLQATVTNFATNFLSSGIAGYFLFEEHLSSRWFAGAFLIVVGVFVLSKSSIDAEKKPAD